MFTGIIFHRGEWLGGKWLDDQKYRASIRVIGATPEDLVLGESIAVNGCCLTLVCSEQGILQFDLLAETLKRTTLGDLVQGHTVNLERSLQVSDRWGGHFVTGHIDTTGKVLFFGQDGKDYRLTIGFAPQYRQWLVEKGCIAIDGISLTVAAVSDSDLTVWLIPHTLQETNLTQLSEGSRVNLEFDLLAKYVMNRLPLPISS
jgi:riboflavin synthase